MEGQEGGKVKRYGGHLGGDRVVHYLLTYLLTYSMVQDII